jgi:L-fuculose-phosphate aldolase
MHPIWRPVERRAAAAWMRRMGAITYAHELEQAVKHSLLLEWACELYWRAAAIGTPRTLDEQQQIAVVTAAVEKNYGTTRRIEP